MTREEAIAYFKKNVIRIKAIMAEEGEALRNRFFQSLEATDMAIKALEQEPMTGHWINIEDRTDWYDAAYKCSCCGREIITPYELKNNLYSDYPYCHCGARMVESQESEGKE